MKNAGIGPIAIHFPKIVEDNALLQAENPSWDMKTIGEKTGILSRFIAEENETSADLGFLAAQKLFNEHDIDPASIDFLLLCTQTPDYTLPTTACLLQHRLGLRTDSGALDFNLGCSGFVYGLSLADGLIRAGSAKRILLITAETYSKLIAPTDRSLRTIFGDAAAATLIEPTDQASIWGMKFGTDGSGGDTLLAPAGGFRKKEDQIQPRARKRWPSELYMDGPSLISFTIGKIPETLDEILKSAGLAKQEIGYYLFHQATHKMLEQLRTVLQIDESKLPIRIAEIGNTVSSTLPILIQQMRDSKELTRSQKNLLVGFGVGWSWAGCVWQDILGPNSG